MLYISKECIGLSVYELIGGCMLIVSGLFLIIVVLLQEGKENGLSGVIQSGSAESFLNVSGNRTKDAKLKKLTKFFAILFFFLVIVADLFEIIAHK